MVTVRIIWWQLRKRRTITTYQFSTNLTFIGPCIVIYSYNKTKKNASVSQITRCKTLYMFRTVFPSIIRSSRLHICLLLYVQSWAPDDGRKDRPKHVECFTRINNLRNRSFLLVFAIGINYFAIDVTGEVFILSDDSGLVLLNFLLLKSHIHKEFHMNWKIFWT